MTSESERRQIVDPDMGLVLGCRLGAPVEGVVAEWPGGDLVRAAIGRVTYSLTQRLGACSAPVCVRYQFVDDRLVAVELAAAFGAPDGVERNLHRQLAAEIEASLAVQPGLRDEGYVEYARGELSVTIDALDAVIRFEEAL